MPVAPPCLVSMACREAAIAWKWHSNQELQSFRNDGVAHIQPGKMPGPAEVLAEGRGSLESVVEREMVSISFSSEIKLCNRGCSSSYQPFSHKISFQEIRFTRHLAKLFPDGEKSPRKQVVVSPSELRCGRYCGSTQVPTVGQSLHP